MSLSGLIQCSGEASYVNDILTPSSSVYCAFVTAKRVGASIELIDPRSALQCKGVLGFYAAKDIPGVNSIVTVTRETPMFRERGSLKWVHSITSPWNRRQLL